MFYMPIFEITPEDISQLNDTDLRSLVGHLCEAELSSSSDPISSVRWGGNQNAADGGLDVEVVLESPPLVPDFIQRKHTGIQVKKPSMARMAIINEMRPNGILRPIICQLIHECGSYVIATSGDDCSSSMLTNRLNAMHEALEGEKQADNLHLDFYDRSRLATWVRSHPSMVLWVRQKIGRSVSGWRPFGNWAGSPEGEDDAYLLDDNIRLRDGHDLQEDGLQVVEGINRLRQCLSAPKTATRLAGLSGVGKTRLVQALFEPEIGENPLDRFLAVYVDIGSKPTPSARDMAETLIAKQKHAILIIDNCPPDVHHQLAELLKIDSCQISLLTVEYDVADDEPEDTNVFRLEPSGEDLIERLVCRRYAYIGQVDARTIAQFSGGNARIALALARTLDRGESESLSGFNDTRLFQRLFRQRQSEDQSLLNAAEVFSLVYSFDGESTQDGSAELLMLGELIDENIGSMHRASAELLRRQLAQQRGKWRAVLPQAIANRLAKQALQNIPCNRILETFNYRGRERLMKSFSRRLSYLHDSPEAQDIVTTWLSDGGLLGSIDKLNALGVELFINVAPVAPRMVLEAIERAANAEDGNAFTSRENSNFSQWINLLVKLAYETDLFERSVALLIQFARTERKDENYNSIRNLLKGLFQLHLSGTHAPAELRATVITRLVSSSDPINQQIGFELLGAALEAWHFRASRNFDFGARPRDYGYTPQTRSDVHAWYSCFLTIIARLAQSEDLEIEAAARDLMAESFRGLWLKAGMFDELEAIVMDIRSCGMWIDGWLSARKTIRFDSKAFSPDTLEKLNSIADSLAPNNLLEHARTYAFADAWDIEDSEPEDEEDPSRPYRHIQLRSEELGNEVASNPEVLNCMLAELISGRGSNILMFGRGLAGGAVDRAFIWNLLVAALKECQQEERNYAVLCGFIQRTWEILPEQAESWLDSALDDSDLRRGFVFLQTSIDAGHTGFQRFMHLLSFDDAPIWQFQNLGYGQAHVSISDDDLAALLLVLVEKQNGPEVALGIISMRFHGANPVDHTFSSDLVISGRRILSCIFQSDERDTSGARDYKVSKVVTFCLSDLSPEHEINHIFREFSEAIITDRMYTFDYSRSLRSMARCCPPAFLTSFLGNNDFSNHEVAQIFFDRTEHEKNLFSEIDSEVILAWCSEDPIMRYARIAAVIKPFEKMARDNEQDDEDQGYRLTDLALQILNEAPEPAAIIDAYVQNCTPMSWSGSRATIITRGRQAIERLQNLDNLEIAQVVNSAVSILRDQEASERSKEAERDREQEQRFE